MKRMIQRLGLCLLALVLSLGLLSCGTEKSDDEVDLSTTTDAESVIKADENTVKARPITKDKDGNTVKSDADPVVLPKRPL